MKIINTNRVKDMSGEHLRYQDEVTFQADGGEQTGHIMGFKGLLVSVKSLRGRTFTLPPDAVMTNHGADRIVAEAEARRAK